MVEANVDLKHRNWSGGISSFGLVLGIEPRAWGKVGNAQPLRYTPSLSVSELIRHEHKQNWQELKLLSRHTQ